jgi:hypothetical protein
VPLGRPDRLGERIRALGLADPAREQGVAGQDVAGRQLEGDAALGMAGGVQHGDRVAADGQGVAVLQHPVGGDPDLVGDGLGVGPVGAVPDVVGLEDSGQGLDVVGVAVGGDDPGQGHALQQLQQPLGLVGRVDQQGVVGLGVAQQVGVVLVRPDVQLGHLEGAARVAVRWPAPVDVGGVEVRHVRLLWNVGASRDIVVTGVHTMWGPVELPPEPRKGT